MQAVILAAGRGTRMLALTEDKPKPLLEVLGKPLIEYQFDTLPDSVNEVIVIVGYLGSSIQKKYGGTYNGRTLLYVEQDVLDGTAGALWRAAPLLKDRFLVLMSDDIYAKKDAERCLEKKDWVMLVQKTPHMIAGGHVVVDKKGHVVRIEEGSHGGKPGLISTNMFALDPRLFEYDMVPKSAGSPEFGLPQSVLAASQASGVPFSIENATQWVQISSPQDLDAAAKILSQKN